MSLPPIVRTSFRFAQFDLCQVGQASSTCDFGFLSRDNRLLGDPFPVTAQANPLGPALPTWWVVRPSIADLRSFREKRGAMLSSLHSATKSLVS